MGMKLPPDLEAEILRRADRRDAPAIGPAPVFADEAAFQAAVVREAKALGWLCFHVRDSRKCEPGFPDLIFLRGPRMIVAELKRSKAEKPSASQQRWLKAFQCIGDATVRLWTPEDWTDILKEIA